ncbi:SH3 domain-containing protein [Pseudorhodobacter wandonensis]|uniref:SH3 domain-containing protein n=1 Tax=Pseudorhodobacter wandonensis TaxID=1120568 RepID=UPI00067C07D1|nr:SH3 domain-containing protein [Pseudorhodobacter wandonensis]
MFKLLSLLAAGMFVTLLIGGEDRGQSRQGLIGVAQNPVERPVVREAKVAPVKAIPVKPAPTANLALISFTPAKVQKPARATSTIAGEFVLSEPKQIAITQAVAPPETVVPEAVVPEAAPIMYVNSRSVNVRQGPSTDYEVVGRLVRAEAVSVIAPEVDGWVRIAIEGDGLEGFIAARLLSQTDPGGN